MAEGDAKPGDVFVNAILKGELALVETMLKERHTNGLEEAKYEDSSGSAAYTVAIQEGYVVMVQMLLKYNIPLGDALLRAVDADFMDAVEEICSYARKHPKLREAILNSRCENGDLHPRFTPIILAAYNNHYDIVEMLLKMGAFIEEPDPTKPPDTIEESHDFIDIYKALCSEAYMSLAATDPIETAFGLHDTLHKLRDLMSDFSAEFTELADRVRTYTGEILGQCRSTEEIMAIMTYEAERQDREAPEGTRFLLVKLLRAIEYNQKEFVAHPNCQQILITHFYRGLSSYRDWNPIKQVMFTVFMLLGYPVISLIYLLIPSMKIKRFVRIPFVKFLLHTGADLTFLGVLVFISYSREITPTVNFMINYAVLFTLGIAWKHCKEIMADGIIKYLSNGRNLLDTLILILYTSAFMTEASGAHQINTEVPQYRLQERSLPVDTAIQSNVLKHHHGFHQSQTDTNNGGIVNPNVDLADLKLNSLDMMYEYNQSLKELDKNSTLKGQLVNSSKNEDKNLEEFLTMLFDFSSSSKHSDNDNLTSSDAAYDSVFDTNKGESPSLSHERPNAGQMKSLGHSANDHDDDVDFEAGEDIYAFDSVFDKLDTELSDYQSAVPASHSRSKRASRGRGSGAESAQAGDGKVDLDDDRENIYTFQANDPRVISRVLFGVVGMCVTMRLISLTAVSENIGPLQISLSAMIPDILKFSLVYAVILLAFAVGLTYIYAPYLNAFHIKCIREGGGTSCVKGKFATFASSAETLFWILLGFANQGDTRLQTDHTIIKFTGVILFALYLVLGVVVMLNLLVGMMGITYTNIEENSDMEWKFSRSKLWSSYMMLGSTVPPPFNLIPSLKSLRRMVYSICCQKLADKENIKMYDEKAKMASEIADTKHYKRVLTTLVSRYVQHEETEGNNAEASLSLQDVRALRNDIISFKYETSLKFQANENISDDAAGCASFVSTSTIPVDDIASTVNLIQEESDKQVQAIRKLKEVVAQLPELAMQGRPPPEPKPPPAPTGKLGSIVRRMASDFEDDKKEDASSQPAMLDILGQLQQKKRDDEVAAAAAASSSRDAPGRRSLTFSDYANMLQSTEQRKSVVSLGLGSVHEQEESDE